MKKIHKLLLLIIIFMSAIIIQVKAQKENINIIPNGGYEEWIDGGQPIGWRVASDFSPEQVQERRPESPGIYALKIWLNGGSIYLAQPVSVKAGKQYTFSFWYKGNAANNEIAVTLLWYDNGRIKGREKVLSVRTVRDEWRKAEGVVTIPENVHSMGMGVKTQRAYQAYMLFDDMSMVLKRSGPDIPSVLEAPHNLRIKAYQSEMEISWDKAMDEEVKWEVMFDGKIETITSGNSYMKTKLKPASEHHVKVRAVKGKEFSPYAERKGVTEEMRKSENSEDRIPYLRTITPDGSCKGRFLKLYYNELANPDAKISYKLNGVVIEPQNNTLEFPEFEGFYKQFRLEIYIDEGEGCEWEILYPQLGVNRNEK
ncbi:carbohydrate binding domain-containing protein [Bacteroides hominis]|uniref:carbohydrate binding domain-containing protein n=1 Tax=Bacteroides hominis TaxID=2763023 RepID=UPI003D6ABB12